MTTLTRTKVCGNNVRVRMMMMMMILDPDKMSAQNWNETKRQKTFSNPKLQTRRTLKMSFFLLYGFGEPRSPRKPKVALRPRASRIPNDLRRAGRGIRRSTRLYLPKRSGRDKTSKRRPTSNRTRRERRYGMFQGAVDVEFRATRQRCLVSGNRLAYVPTVFVKVIAPQKSSNMSYTHTAEKLQKLPTGASWQTFSSAPLCSNNNRPEKTSTSTSTRSPLLVSSTRKISPFSSSRSSSLLSSVSSPTVPSFSSLNTSISSLYRRKLTRLE